MLPILPQLQVDRLAEDGLKSRVALGRHHVERAAEFRVKYPTSARLPIRAFARVLPVAATDSFGWLTLRFQVVFEARQSPAHAGACARVFAC